MSSEQQGKSTPRPWTWQNFGSGPLLTSCVSGRPIVMDFVRKGMHGAEPRFGKRTDSMGGIMVPLSEWESLPPDAQLIVTAVNERDQLLSFLAERQEEVEKLRAALTGAALNRRDGPCWCGELRNPSGDNHVSWCVQAKAALNPIS